MVSGDEFCSMRSGCRAAFREEISRLRNLREPEKGSSGVPAGLADDFAENPGIRAFENCGRQQVFGRFRGFLANFSVSAGPGGQDICSGGGFLFVII